MTRTTVRALALIGFCALLPAQETRGTLSGRVLDSSGAAIAGAQVQVTNSETNHIARLTTNETGYYEAPLLQPGDYQVAVEAPGFKKVLRRGITLGVAGKLEVNLALEVGAVSESITVSGEAGLLETNAESSGTVVDKRSLQDLPTLNNNPTLLAELAPGMQSSGSLGYNNPAFTLIGSTYTISGNVGGNNFSIDGVPNNANIRRVSFQPHTDAVQEFKVETSNFDVSTGHTTGANFTVMTKSGTNQWHGSASLQHWRNEWNAGAFFAKQTHFRSIAEAETSGDLARAARLRGENYNPPGHSNNYSGTFGGPLTLPRLYRGKDRTFFFISYSGLKDRTQASTSYWNRTVPTLAQRTGDFSDLLQVDAVRYQLFIRTPIPGNVIPSSRIINPVYNQYVKYYPVPNNNPASPNLEPLTNYIAGQMPWRFDYGAWAGRIDHQQSERHRYFVRGQYWTNREFNQDWMYSTVPGAGGGAGQRLGVGVGGDWVWTPSASTFLDLSAGYQRFNDAVEDSAVRKIKPSAVGLPAYLDAKAGDAYTLPEMDFSGYDSVGKGYSGQPNRHTSIFTRLDGTHVRGSHTVRFGFDQQQLYKNTFGFGTTGLNTSGAFAFDNSFTRRNDDTNTPAGNLGHSWAAFMMGLPAQATIGTYDSGALKSSFYGWYAQDSWRLTRKLTLNFGLRLEYELAPTERYNRAIGYFDPNAKLPIADLAKAAYAKAPVAQLSAASFNVTGGSAYLGADGVPRNFWRNAAMWLPRAAAAYQLGSRMVLRGGYGVYYDTLNVRDFSYTFPNQQGYSVTTTTVMSSDYGQTFTSGNPAAGVSPMTDPFPIRADGLRFNQPVQSALGAMAIAGRSFSYFPYNMEHARQQRWRIGLQRQVGANLLLEAAYSGSYSDNVYISRTDQPLAAQYWSQTAVRNNSLASDMNANVANPFAIASYASLKTSDPLVYQDMASNSFFTTATIRKNRLLRDYPQINGVTNSYRPDAKVKTHALEARLQKRFSRGFNLNLGYTRMYARAADFFMNEYDPEPTWRESNNTRPHRITATTVFELPFGKGKPLASHGLAARLLGGFQVAGTYSYQPGALVNFSAVLFYYGELDAVRKDSPTPDSWFNTSDFERNSTKSPASFQARLFSPYFPGVRAASVHNTNSNVQREFRIRERARLLFRFDVLNLFNHTTFGAPGSNPLNTDFGRVSTQTGAPNRFLQLQAKLRF
jgi:hypothetical protein